MTNVNTPYTSLPVTVGSLTGEEIIAVVQSGTTKQTTVQNLASGIYYIDFPANIEYVINGVGAPILAGVAGFLAVPFACTIRSATLLADQAGSIVVDIWKSTYDQYAGTTFPTSANSITSATPPTIASTTKAQNTTLSGWTTSLDEDDILVYKVVSAATVTRATLSLHCTRTIVSS